MSGRIAALLDSAMRRTGEPVQACLDDLLGAVYNLFFAVQLELEARGQDFRSGTL